MTKAIAQIDPPAMPAAMIEKAISSGADLEKLEKLMGLQERWEANEARKAYHTAMAAFKAAPPKIVKDRAVGYESKAGLVGYRHASLANVTSTINAALSKYGLSAAWTTKQNNGAITVTCTVTHDMGHSESTELTAAPDNSGSKNPIQAIGSTITYLERYTLLALTGLATEDQDDDAVAGGAVEIEYITEDQAIEIADMIRETKTNKAKFLQVAGADSIDSIRADKYSYLVKKLRDKAAKSTREPGQDG